MIEEFGVWFGKPIWRRKYNGVWYSSDRAAGRFRKAPAARESRHRGRGRDGSAAAAPPLDRIIVAFAGPLFSFCLALVLACIVWAIGKPSSQPDMTTRIIVLPNGPAAKAGLKSGDRILAIDGKPVSRFSGPVNSVMWGIISSEGDKIHFTVDRNGHQEEIDSGWEKEEGSKWARKPKRRVMIGPLIVPEVISVEANGPVAQAGLKAGDVVTSVNGTPVIALDQVSELLKSAPSAPVPGHGAARVGDDPGDDHPAHGERTGRQARAGARRGVGALHHGAPFALAADRR